MIFLSFSGCVEYYHKALSSLLFLSGLTWLHIADRRLHNSCSESSKYKHVGGKYGNAQYPCSPENTQLLARFRFLYSNRCWLISAMWSWALGTDTMAADVWNCRIRWHPSIVKVFHQKDKVWEIISSQTLRYIHIRKARLGFQNIIRFFEINEYCEWFTTCGISYML